MDVGSAGRKTNLALLLLVPAAVATGLLSNGIGVDWVIDSRVVHGVAGLAVALLTPWKTAIVRRGLRRRRGSRWVSLGLLGAVAVTIVSGVYHVTGIGSTIGPLTVMQVHVGGGVVALVLTAAHYRSRPVRPHRFDLDRRALIRSMSLTASGSALWLALDGVWGIAGLPGSRRRFTGSHEVASGNPEAMPVVSWFDDSVQTIDPTTWTVTIDGVGLSLADLAAMPHDDVTAVIDCTGGWQSTQIWSGVRLDRLVEPGSRSFEVVSVTGYPRRFPSRDLDQTWLVTAAGGAPLSAGHGFPARIVAPGRRGFWWVKWVSGIRTSDIPWWVQSPFPLT